MTAHPLTNSLCLHLADRAGVEVAKLGWQVERLDLYQTAFSPVLTAAERASTDASVYDCSAVVAEIAALQRAGLLKLVFPT